MTEESAPSASEFGQSFKNFLEKVAAQPSATEPPFRKHLREHFGADPAQLPIVTEDFEAAEHPNVHLAIESFLQEEGRASRLLGMVTPHEYMGMTLSQLAGPGKSGLYGGDATEGPVEYINIAVAGGEVLACLQVGLHLVAGGDGPLAVLMRGPSEHTFTRKVHLEVMGSDKAQAEGFLATVRRSMRKRSVYRGHILSLSEDRREGLMVQFHTLPTVDRDSIILPQGLLERIERQTVHFSRLSQALLRAGRHLKRGILLYGPPGTGKTLTAMHLASRMEGRTVFLVTGRGMGLVEQACTMARMLQPATVILEDVDLVAEERTHQNTACNTVLFELLNQMDGLADDADVLFLLTTNRAEILEPALAARPGRVDQAIEIPLPDAACRDRLFDLYGRGLNMQLGKREQFLTRTEGVSAAFVRELLRKAAVIAADDGDPIQVRDAHVEEALHELIVEGGELTQRLLGVQSQRPTR